MTDSEYAARKVRMLWRTALERAAADFEAQARELLLWLR